MPEIPLTAVRVGTKSPEQATDTGATRLMGEASGALGDAMFKYGDFLDDMRGKLRSAEMDWRVNAAKEELQYEVEKARLDKRFNDPVNDPTGVQAMEQLNKYSNEVQLLKVEKYGITGNHLLKFRAEAQGVTNTIAVAYAGDSIKDTVSRTSTLQEQTLSSQAFAVRTNPMLLSEELTKAETNVWSDPSLRDDEKELKSIQAKRMLVRSAIDGRKNANGPMGMGVEDYDTSRQILVNSGELFTREERDQIDKDLFNTFHDGVKVRTAMDDLDTKTKDKAKKERAERAMVLLDDEREQAGNDPIAIAKWSKKVQAMRASQHITSDQARSMLSYEPATINLQDQVAGGTVRQMLFDVSLTKKQAARVGISTARKDNLSITTEFINNRFAAGKISAKKREELINEVQSIREFERRSGRSFIEELNKAKFQAEVTAVENTVLDPKARAEIKSRLYEEAIRQAKVTNSTSIDVGTIRDSFIVGYGPQFGQTTVANKSESQLVQQARNLKEELSRTTDPVRRKALIQQGYEIGNQIENMRKFNGGNSGSSGNSSSNRSRRGRATTED